MTRATADATEYERKDVKINKVREDDLKLKKLALASIILITVELVVFTHTNIPESKAATPKVAVSKIYGLNQNGTTFTINITVTDVTEMFGWVMNLSWDPSIAKITTGDPEGLIRGQTKYGVYEGDLMRNASTTFFLANSIDNTKGSVESLACFFVTTGYTISGSGLLASINFTLVNVGTTAINSTGPSTLTPGHSALLNRNGQEIIHDEEEGLVTNQGPPPPPPVWTEDWFQTLIAAVILGGVVPAAIIVTIIRKLRGKPPITDEELEKLGEFDEEIEGDPLVENSD